MNVLCHITRSFGCWLGLFFVVSGVADVFGFVPHSEEMPPWTARLISNAPPILVGVVLLAPVRHFLRGTKAKALAFAYAVASIWVLRLAVGSLSDFAAGGKHWAIVPISLALAAIALANGAVLLYRCVQTSRPPNHSVKPTPSARLN
jgi:hypothetical protein